jgi:hypothetical protein
MNFARKTVKFRHAIVKLIAPNLYVDMIYFKNWLSATPRPMTLFLKNHFKNHSLVGAEIGTASGDNALSLLQELQIKKLFLIDPYIPYVEGGRPLSFQETEQAARDKLSEFSQTVWLHKTSSDAVKDVQEPLDFVYIDGNHSYEYVKQDIANYYPLVKQGGVIGGHDYIARHDVGIYRAVTEFAKNLSGGFYTVFPDWWIVK